jgi:hypothetical protein
MLNFHYRIHWNNTEKSIASKRQVVAAKKKTAPQQARLHNGYSFSTITFGVSAK